MGDTAGGKPTESGQSSQMAVEYALLQVPIERLRLSLRTSQREIDAMQKKMAPLAAQVVELAKNGAGRQDLNEQIDVLLGQLRQLKTRLEEENESCQVRYQELTARQAHLLLLPHFRSMGDAGFDDWSRIRLDRFLAGYMLHTGRLDTARLLIEKKNLGLFCDADLWEHMCRLEAQVRAGDLADVLAWCDRHRHQLKKISSPLEFFLRMQQFLELIKLSTPEARIQAIAHSQKYLSQEQFAKSVFPLLSRLLVFWGTENQHKYAALFDEIRYSRLADLFISSAQQLYSFPARPLLLASLSAGVSVLKTPLCGTTGAAPSRLATAAPPGSGASTVCPVCSPELREIADGLPYGHHTTSHVDGDLVMLPTGNVYSRHSLDRANSVLGLADSQSVIDPAKPGVRYKRSALSKVYIS